MGCGASKKAKEEASGPAGESPSAETQKPKESTNKSEAAGSAAESAADANDDFKPVFRSSKDHVDYNTSGNDSKNIGKGSRGLDFSPIIEQLDSTGKGGIDKQELLRCFRCLGNNIVPLQVIDIYWESMKANDDMITSESFNKNIPFPLYDSILRNGIASEDEQSYKIAGFKKHIDSEKLFKQLSSDSDTLDSKTIIAGLRCIGISREQSDNNDTVKKLFEKLDEKDSNSFSLDEFKDGLIDDDIRNEISKYMGRTDDMPDQWSSELDKDDLKACQNIAIITGAEYHPKQKLLNRLNYVLSNKNIMNMADEDGDWWQEFFTEDATLEHPCKRLDILLKKGSMEHPSPAILPSIPASRLLALFRLYHIAFPDYEVRFRLWHQMKTDPDHQIQNENDSEVDGMPYMIPDKIQENSLNDTGNTTLSCGISNYIGFLANDLDLQHLGLPPVSYTDAHPRCKPTSPDSMRTSPLSLEYTYVDIEFNNSLISKITFHSTPHPWGITYDDSLHITATKMGLSYDSSTLGLSGVYEWIGQPLPHVDINLEAIGPADMDDAERIKKQQDLEYCVKNLQFFPSDSKHYRFKDDTTGLCVKLVKATAE